MRPPPVNPPYPLGMPPLDPGAVMAAVQASLTSMQATIAKQVSEGLAAAEARLRTTAQPVVTPAPLLPLAIDVDDPVVWTVPRFVPPTQPNLKPAEVFSNLSRCGGVAGAHLVKAIMNAAGKEGIALMEGVRPLGSDEAAVAAAGDVAALVRELRDMAALGPFTGLSASELARQELDLSAVPADWLAAQRKVEALLNAVFTQRAFRAQRGLVPAQGAAVPGAGRSAKLPHGALAKVKLATGTSAALSLVAARSLPPSSVMRRGRSSLHR